MDAGKPPRAPIAGSEPSSEKDIVGSVVGASVWAPSIHNTQPWSFSSDGGGISLHADASRQLPVADPSGREMMVSCGAALFTARVALRSLGYIPETTVLPDSSEPLLVARSSWHRRAAPTEFESRLFGQVRQRRTHRGGFGPLPLSASLISVLQEGAEHDGATLRILPDEASRAMLAGIVQEAEQALQADGAYLREIAAWTPAPDSARRDGVPVTSYPPGWGSTVGRFAGRDFAHGHRWGAATVSAVPQGRSAGLVCLLTTARDMPMDWVNAGQALQRILLTCAVSGVAAALHSQPLELARTREFIRTRLAGGAFPQMIARLGTVIQNAASVRRPVPSVLLLADAHEPRDEESRPPSAGPGP
jgi:hypothetical protein